MSPRKKEKLSIFNNKAVKVWIIVSSVLIAFLLLLTIIARAVPFCYNSLNSFFGGERRVLVSGDPSKYMRYHSDYTDKSAAKAAANALNEQICEEGIVLLKNENDTLPLSGVKTLSIFGKNSVNPVVGGSGSSENADASVIDFYTALQNAGFLYNPTLKGFYESSVSGDKRPSPPGFGTILTGFPIAEAPLSAYTKSVKESYASYADAAIVFISRIGGEGYDLPRSMFWNGSNYTTWSGSMTVPGARAQDDHYLRLDQNETDMIKEACTNFNSVVLIINSSAPLELGFLDDPAHYAYHANLKAALWIGNPGGSGFNALGRVLNGSVNPSGRLVDTYARNFESDPVWSNFGNNLKADGNRYTVNGNGRNAYFVSYEEGIYVGYRYWETRGFLEDGDWYKESVVYPFGYGKSYTSFKQTIAAHSLAAGGTLGASDTVSIDVKVTNTGEYAGKEVVQLYYTPQYKSGGIEKAHVVLAAFGKTGVIEPGESETVKLAFKVRDMASYDYSDANKNGFKGYELDVGTYTVRLMRDSHEQIDAVDYTVDENIQYPIDDTTKTPIENLFNDMSDYNAVYLSRSDWTGTWPQAPTEDDRAVDNAFINSFTYVKNDLPTDPWYTTVMPIQSDKTLSAQNTDVKLYDLIDKEYSDPLWNSLLNQLTIAQMTELVSVGHFRTLQIENIEKPLTTDADGPTGYVAFVGDTTIYDVGFYASGCVLSASRNAVLAEKFGVMIGNEGLLGNQRGDGRPYSGWYAPAMNIHRSQFSGRNFEYYSEDGYLSGVIAQAVVKGANSKGVYSYCKHFALNDQETNRETNGLATWANEQAMREIYLRPFEMSVKSGRTTAVMSSFNRVGTVWAGGSYNLLTRLLREEWGFEGMVITDFNMSRYMSADQMIRAGGDLNLSISKPSPSASTATEVTSLRRAVKNILYTVSKSNAMNGYGDGVVYRYAIPYWLASLIAADTSVFVLCCAWGAFVIFRAARRLGNSADTE